jgi:hypothetical protein
MSRFRIPLFFAAALALLVLGLVVGRFAGSLLGPRSPAIWNTATLLKQVQSLSRLVTVKYVLEKVVVVEDVKWYGENRVLLLAHGSVNAGIDLADLQPGDLDLHGKTIVMRLPPPSITDAYLDESETKVIERTTGLLRTFDKTLEQNARQQAVDDLRRAARNGGILKEANQRGREQISALFRQLGFEVEFRDR